VPTRVVGLTVTVRSVDYTVQKAENNGTGVSTLYLKT
jgi:hypothetical protein